MTGRHRAWRVFLWAMALGTMAVIFFFSAQAGEESGGLSERIACGLLRALSPGFDGWAPERQRLMLDRVGHLVRKGAHFGEYAFLALWLCLLMKEYSARGALPWAWAGATIYAATDEAHQLLIPGRAGTIADMLLDSAGALCGAAAAWLLSRWRTGKRKGKTLE